MFVSKKHIARRTFLRGAGVTLALPLLESMLPALTPTRMTAAAPVRRFVGIWHPHGAAPGYWSPLKEGKDFDFSFITKPGTVTWYVYRNSLPGQPQSGTLVDAGTTGPYIFGGFRNYVIDRARTREPAELQQRVADAAAGAVDEHALAGDEARAAMDHLIRGQEVEHQRDRFGVVDAVGRRHQRRREGNQQMPWLMQQVLAVVVAGERGA